jgi:hypothetical protein
VKAKRKLCVDTATSGDPKACAIGMYFYSQLVLGDKGKDFCRAGILIEYVVLTIHIAIFKKINETLTSNGRYVIIESILDGFE